MAREAGAKEKHFYGMEEDVRRMRMAYFAIRTTGEKLEEKLKVEVNGIKKKRE